MLQANRSMDRSMSAIVQNGIFKFLFLKFIKQIRQKGFG